MSEARLDEPTTAAGTLLAVFENGVLRPLSPLTLAEGETVLIEVRQTARPSEPSNRTADLVAALDRFGEATADVPAEEWDAFQHELEENRRWSASWILKEVAKTP